MKDTELKALVQEAEATSERVHDLLEGEPQEGMRPTRGTHSIEAIDAFVEILEQAAAGKNSAMYALREAAQIADFPYLFGDTLDRSLMAQFKAWVPEWTSFCKIGSPLRDFRAAKRFGLTGMMSVLTAVGEREEYMERGPAEETPKTIQAAKYGAKFGVSFETLINDDLGAIAELPQRLAVAARRTEAVAVSALYCDANGPHASLYTSGNKNIVNTSNGAASNNPVLSIAALGDALFVMGKQLDADGHPILIDSAVLVVPPALEVTARNILNAIQVNVAVGGGAYNGANQIVTENWMRNRLSLVVDPYIPITAASANGSTSWFVFANPLTNRPAIEMAYLAGHDSPELFVKAPNANRLGGGAAPEDFDYDMVWYKMRHIFGTAQIDGRLSVASNGSGS